MKRNLIILFKGWKQFYLENNVLRLILDRLKLAELEKSLLISAQPSDIEDFNKFMEENIKTHKSVPTIKTNLMVVHSPINNILKSEVNFTNAVQTITKREHPAQIQSKAFTQNQYWIGNLKSRRNRADSKADLSAYKTQLISNNQSNSRVSNLDYLGIGVYSANLAQGTNVYQCSGSPKFISQTQIQPHFETQQAGCLQSQVGMIAEMFNHNLPEQLKIDTAAMSYHSSQAIGMPYQMMTPNQIAEELNKWNNSMFMFVHNKFRLMTQRDQLARDYELFNKNAQK